MNSEKKRSEWIKKSSRIVIKLGSGILTTNSSVLNEELFKAIAEEISSIRQRGIDVVIVSSGAVTAGMKQLEMKHRPKKLVDKQVAAAVGQTKLMWLYEKSFNKHGQKVAQILITHDDLANRKRFINARHTINSLLEKGVIPIINENDTVAVDEIKLGDNDELSSLVVNLLDCPLLIILSDVDGLFDANPKKNKDAKLLSFVDDIGRVLQTEGLESDGLTGTGGMYTKLSAAQSASAHGAATVIANGRIKGVLGKVLRGDNIGTFFAHKQNKLISRKHWIAFALKKRGSVTVDNGALKALLNGGKSLLPSGIVSISGSFDAGDMVSCLDECGQEFARGIVSFSSKDIDKIKGIHTSKIIHVLGYSPCDEVIHRDDLVLHPF